MIRRGRHAVRRGRALAAVAALTALAGCSGFGGTSPVESGLEIGGAEVPRVRVFFPGPVMSATPEQIVRGFLRSGAASDGDYDTAREFLTPDAAKGWEPDGDVLVFSAESELQVQMPDEATAVISAPVVARITSEGRYLAAPAGTIETTQLHFARVDEEWRIASLPDGFARWISAADLRRLFQPYAVHYVATDRRTLIRDLRWFPLDHLTSRLAQAQLAPVPADLAGVATTAVPPGARLAADSVSTVDGVATVELSARPTADQTIRQNLWAQFVATLTQDPSVASVALQVDGSPIDPPGATAPVRDPAQVGFTSSVSALDAEPLVRQGERLSALDVNAPLTGLDPQVTDPPRTDLPALPAGVTGLAVSVDGRNLAGVSADRATLVRWVGATRQDIGPGAGALSDPTFDVRGHLWVGSAPSSGASLHAVPPAAGATASGAGPVVAQPVVAHWLAGRTVLAVRVSPDGERAAIISTDGGVPIVQVAGVVRGPGGLPTALADAVTLGEGVPAASGLVWVDLTTVVTLADPGGASARPVALSLDGTSVELAAVPGAIAVTSSGDIRRLIVRTADGRVLVRSGRLWLAAGSGSEVLVPGR
ncbi:MAG: LpqB family beta-propeller domain-containing protein [Actinobacteria bacterium]|nr:LpqB family beta-propeller domain-containing protein [Actinomycetota bacterium]